jgi:molybdopterin converting factor small subunit
MSRIVLVNGRDVEDDQQLESGDVVDVFPPLAGGGSSRARW